MRVTRLLVVGVILCASAASTSRASAAGLIVIQLGDEEPTRLCVLSRVVCGPDKRPCPNTARLNRLAKFFDDRENDIARFTPDSSEDSDIPREITDTLSLLAVAPSEPQLCSGGSYRACAPGIDLREFHKLSESGQLMIPLELTGQIICGIQRGAQGAAHLRRDGKGEGEPRNERSRPQRVALLSLAFHEGGKNGINGIELDGTEARIYLTSPKPASGRVKVIGGNYTSLSEDRQFTANQSVTVPLRPRCARSFAQVPAHKAGITEVELQVGDDRYRCAPRDPRARVIPLELPFTSADKDKSLTVTYGGTVTSEAHWSQSVPPSQLQLGPHMIRFSWRRPVGCLAETWRDLTPKKDKEDKEWGPACPRAKLSNATTCKLDGENENQQFCRYRCEVPPTVNLPVPVTFERMRTHPDAPNAPSELLYSWSDSIDAVDQELTSVVPPADRRVILEFADPAQWKDRLGDEIDEIQIRSGQSVDVIHLHDTELPPPSWVSLPSAGRTCGDRARVAIVGTWRYLEKTFDVPDGRIELSWPYKYRKATLFYGLAGTGGLIRHLTSNARSAAFLDLGFGLLIDPVRRWSSLRSLLLDVEATGQITHTFYEGIELSSQQPADFTAVTYLRFDLRVAVEWWWRRRVGLALAGGFGLGTPLHSDDARMVGALRRSELFELHPVIFALLPTRLWFLAGVGGRTGEQHRDYRTDFLGSPTPDRERDWQWYMFLRFRTALE